MFPSDKFCRAAVFPNFTRKNQFDSAALLAFSSYGHLSKALSLASWDKCGDDASVHDFGLNVASSKNATKQVKLGRPLIVSESAHYLGFYSFFARSVHEIPCLHTSYKIRHAPEDGDDRHFHFELHPREGVEDIKKSRMMNEL